MKLAFITQFCLIFAINASGVQLEFLADYTIKIPVEYKKTLIGGLSGMFYDTSDSKLVVVSDDRGKVNEPRIYKFKVDILESKEDKTIHSFKVSPVELMRIKNQKSKFYKQDELDLEGIALLPWGGWLLSSEGDNNTKPRKKPQLFEIKASNGKWVRDFEVPQHFIPEISGEQKKGIQNNNGFEGLSSFGNVVFAMAEDTLVQDKPVYSNQVRLLKYQMTEAWVLKNTQEYFYPIDPVSESVVLGRGVSEILALSEDKILVMERAAFAKDFGVQNSIKIFEVTIPQVESNSKNATETKSDQNNNGSDVKPQAELSQKQSSTQDPKKPILLDKKLILDLDQIKSKFKTHDKLDNFEAMSFGPKLKDGSQTILMASDDNFNKTQKTVFLLFKYKE